MADDRDPKGISVKKSENFSQWYVDAITKSEFVDYSDVSGAMIFRPSAYFVWQELSAAVDKMFREDGVENVYFPLFIPEKFLKKEVEHFAGFTPEVAWVTEVGNTKLAERLAVRPTSETIMYPSYSKWIRSWRDLPMRYNQWNNVVRWEFKHPTPFIRSREFLWNEGHSVFADEEEARKERNIILGIYRKILKEYLALPGIIGKKSEKEKFAGAVDSYSIEHIMPDGWAIQGPDFHFDGQKFAMAFEIRFLDKDGQMKYAWQNTYAITTREIGVMVATHGDDRGMVIPPKLAKIQVVIVPIVKTGSEEKVMTAVGRVFDAVKGKFRAHADMREGISAGYKFNEWEIRGVPVRLEIGLREAESGTVVIARRDTLEKIVVNEGKIAEEIGKTLNSINTELYDRALKKMTESIHKIDTYDAFKDAIENMKGIMHSPWCGGLGCEEKIKEETGAKITNIPFEQEKEKSSCIYCGKDAVCRPNFARSY